MMEDSSIWMPKEDTHLSLEILGEFTSRLSPEFSPSQMFKPIWFNSYDIAPNLCNEYAYICSMLGTVVQICPVSQK